MRCPQAFTKILLIGANLRKIDKVVQTLNGVGAELLFADDTVEGLKLMCLENPNLVICEMELPDGSGADLCRMMRSNSRLGRIPVIFASRSQQGVRAVFDAMHAGADDLFTEFFDSDYFLAKLMWVIEQKNGREVRKQDYEAFRRRQLQTLEIVSETSNLFLDLARERSAKRSGGGTDPVEQQIELGIEMIRSLAGILEEQIRTLESWQISPGLEEVEEYGRGEQARLMELLGRTECDLIGAPQRPVGSM